MKISTAAAFFAASATYAASAMAAAVGRARTYDVPVSKDTFISVRPVDFTAVYGSVDYIHTHDVSNDITSILLGFTLPSESVSAPQRITSCRLTLPPFNVPPSTPVTLVVSPADNTWEESSASGANHPNKIGAELYLNVADPSKPLVLDVADLCKAAAGRGSGFSVYVDSHIYEYTAKSKEGGSPARLSVDIQY